MDKRNVLSIVITLLGLLGIVALLLPTILYEKVQEDDGETVQKAPIIQNEFGLKPFDMEEAISMEFDPWLEDYIEFHKSSIDPERHALKGDARYLVYRCYNGEQLCGGAGDRFICMIKMLYLAMCTGRVLIVDAPFPVKLEEVLNPSHIHWNVDYNKTIPDLADMTYGQEEDFPRRENVLGYAIPDVQGIPRKHSLREILESQCMKDHFASKGWEKDFDSLSVSVAAHQGFWALFQFDPRVVQRTRRIQKATRLRDSYVAIHSRQGDQKLTDNEKIPHEYFHRPTAEKKLMQCYHLFLNEYPDAFKGAYLAADTEDAKTRMVEEDSSIRPSTGVKIFHIDIAVRTFDGEDQYNYEDALDGTIETWAEILALVDSLCLVVISSMMDFAAYYIRGEQHCAVFLRECNSTNVKNPYHSYAAENIFGVKNFGLPVTYEKDGE